MTKKQELKINDFIAKHMQDFYLKIEVIGVPDEITEMLRKELRQIALLPSANLRAQDIVEDFVNLMNRHPELYSKKKAAQKMENVQVVLANPCPNIISSTLREGTVLIENRYGFFDVRFIQEQKLFNKTPEEIEEGLKSTGRKTIFLEPDEKIIVAPTEGRIGTFIDQEMIDGQLTLTFQLIILPQIEREQAKEKPTQGPLENEAMLEYPEL